MPGIRRDRSIKMQRVCEKGRARHRRHSRCRVRATEPQPEGDRRVRMEKIERGEQGSAVNKGRELEKQSNVTPSQTAWRCPERPEEAERAGPGVSVSHPFTLQKLHVYICVCRYVHVCTHVCCFVIPLAGTYQHVRTWRLLTHTQPLSPWWVPVWCQVGW